MSVTPYIRFLLMPKLATPVLNAARIGHLRLFHATSGFRYRVPNVVWEREQMAQTEDESIVLVLSSPPAHSDRLDLERKELLTPDGSCLILCLCPPPGPKY